MITADSFPFVPSIFNQRISAGFLLCYGACEEAIETR